MLADKKGTYSISMTTSGDLASYRIGTKCVCQPIVWKTSKPNVAFVDEYGRIIAIGKGKATVSTKINGTAYKIQVTVR